MPWFRLDDKSAFHAKVIAAGNQAWGAFCRAGAWSSDHGTDGLIPPHIAKTIEPSSKVWARLREVGLLEEVDGELGMHDYLDWNPSAEQVEAKRNARAEAGARGGRERSKRQAEAKQLLGGDLPDASRTFQANFSPSSQFPVPEEKEEISELGPNGPSEPVGSVPGVGMLVWNAYLEGRAKNGSKGPAPILNDKRKKLIRARIKDHGVEVVVAAARGIWLDTWNVEKGQTSIDLAMRDAAHVEKFAALGGASQRQPGLFEAPVQQAELPQAKWAEGLTEPKRREATPEELREAAIVAHRSGFVPPPLEPYLPAELREVAS